MKKTLLTILQVVVTLSILVWIFHDKQKRTDMGNALAHADLKWISIGLLAYGLVEIFATVRWQLLLRVQEIEIGWPRITGLMMIGIFFNQFMPGGTGGDVVKIFYLLKETPGKKTQALLAVLMDRVMGLVGLMLVTGFIIYKKYDWLQSTPDTQKLTWSLIILLGASLLGIVTTFFVTGFNLIHKLPQRMPFRDKFIDLSVAYHAYAKAWPASLLAITVSIGVHLASFYVFYAAARALRASVSLPDFFSVMPIVNTLSSLPISVGGTGARELFFQKLLHGLCGISEGTAVAISLTGFVLVLFWGVIGGLIYLMYRPSEHARLREMQSDVAKLEHEIAENQ